MERKEINIPINEYIDRLLTELEKRIDLQFSSNDERLKATALVLEQRLDVLNHAHQQSLEDRTDFVRNTEYKNKMKELDSLTIRVTESEASAKTWIVALGIVFTIIQLIIVVIGIAITRGKI